MRNMLMAVGVALAVLTIGVPAAEAQRRGGPGGPDARFGGRGGPGGGPGGLRRGGPLGRLRALRQLDLSADQKAQVTNILKNARDEAKPVVAALREKRRALRAAIDSGTGREAARSEFKTSTADLREHLREIRQKTRSAVRSAVGK
jgi:Spy/CpxP family protein refolding chaperone